MDIFCSGAKKGMIYRLFECDRINRYYTMIESFKKTVEMDYFTKKNTLLFVFLTFMIVLLHAKTPERWGYEWGVDIATTFGFIYWTHEVTQIGVPTFFFLSGLLFYCKCNFCDIERKLNSRIKSLLVPYLIWNSIFVFIYYILVHVPIFHEKMNMGDVLGSPREIIYAIVNSRYTVLWFVRDLMLFCALSALIFVSIRNLKSGIIVLGMSILAAIGSEVGYEHPLQWFPMYLSGALVGRFQTYDSKREYSIIMRDSSFAKRLLYSFLLCTFLVVLCYLSGSYGGNLTFLYRLISPYLIWVLVDVMLRDFIERRFVVRPWMKCMFFVYCTHHFVLNVLQKFIVMYFPPTPTVLNVTFVVSAIFVFVLMVAIARFLSQFKFYSLLSGGR